MQKLIERIRNYIDSFEYPTVNKKYEKMIEILDQEFKKPYDEIPREIYSIFELALINTQFDRDLSKFDEIKQLMDNCHKFFEAIDYHTSLNPPFYGNFFECLDNIIAYEKGDIDFSKKEMDILQKKYNSSCKILMKKVFKKEKDKKAIESVEKLYKLTYDDFTMIRFIEFEMARYILVQANDKGFVGNILNEIGGKKVKKRNSRDTQKTVKEIFKKYDINIDKYYNQIMNHHIQVKKYYDGLVKKLNKKKRNYEALITKLEYNKNRYIEVTENELEQIDEPHILSEYLFYVTIHNAKYNEDVNTENIQLKNQQISNIEILFTKYNYNLNELDSEYLDTIHRVNNLDEKLSFLSNCNLKFLRSEHSLFGLLIVNVSLDNMKLINHLFEQEIIDEQFLLKYKEILEDKKQLINFKENIELFKDSCLYEISKYNKDILVLDNDLLIKRLNLFINRYKLSLDQVYNFEFLMSSEIFDLLDNFIELGYYDQIKENPNYLSTKNNLMIKRLIIAKTIGMNVVNEDNSFIGPIATGKNFYVSNNKLDDYIENNNEYYIDIRLNSERIDINRYDLQYAVPLMDYEYDEVSYNINGKVLSKNRILRNIHELKKINNCDLFDAVLYKSIYLTEEDIQHITKIVGHKIKIKK